MKKHIKLLIVLGIVLLSGISFFLGKESKEKDIFKEESSNIKKKDTHLNSVSMMLETGANSGNYEMTTRDSWPTDGYIFNSELSKCENGGELSWDNEKKVVLMSGNVSDKCYVYFDVIPTIADICTSGENLSTCVKNFGDKGYDISKIYIHNSSLQNGANDNSYRYAGAHDVVDNFVCFGTDTKPCPDDNLYRIIGVFGDKVKLIKYDYATKELLGEDGDYIKLYTERNDNTSNYYENNLVKIAAYAWNYKKDMSINNGYGSNTWSTSLLNKINLNTNFINNIGTNWIDKIIETTWKVGGNIHVNIETQPAKVAYQNEIVNPVMTYSTDNQTEYNAKIGLMYVSDYMYAALQDKWILAGSIYNDASKDYRSATSVNWLYMGLVEWTISRCANNENYVFYVNYGGQVNATNANNYLAIRPAFYLSNSVSYLSGSGTKTDPIILGD